MKKVYKCPEIEIIRLDNEISLVLTSEEPPIGPNEGLGKAPQYFYMDEPNIS